MVSVNLSNISKELLETIVSLSLHAKSEHVIHHQDEEQVVHKLRA
jgi:hypothetical protein